MKDNTIIGLGMCAFGHCEKRSRINTKIGNRTVEGPPHGLTCSIYPETAVKSFERRGMCPYDEVGKFGIVSKGKVNPLKASKRGK